MCSCDVANGYAGRRCAPERNRAVTRIFLIHRRQTVHQMIIGDNCFLGVSSNGGIRTGRMKIRADEGEVCSKRFSCGKAPGNQTKLPLNILTERIEDAEPDPRVACEKRRHARPW